jgi:hypothetical protein
MGEKNSLTFDYTSRPLRLLAPAAFLGPGGRLPRADCFALECVVRSLAARGLRPLTAPPARPVRFTLRLPEFGLAATLGLLAPDTARFFVVRLVLRWPLRLSCASSSNDLFALWGLPDFFDEYSLSIAAAAIRFAGARVAPCRIMLSAIFRARWRLTPVFVAFSPRGI